MNLGSLRELREVKSKTRAYVYLAHIPIFRSYGSHSYLYITIDSHSHDFLLFAGLTETVQHYAVMGEDQEFLSILNQFLHILAGKKRIVKVTFTSLTNTFSPILAGENSKSYSTILHY